MCYESGYTEKSMWQKQLFTVKPYCTTKTSCWVSEDTYATLARADKTVNTHKIEGWKLEKWKWEKTKW